MSWIQRQTVTAILIVTIGEELSTPKKKSPMESKGVRVMTDKERQEDEKLKKCLQTAYGATDEQLLKELEEAEASLDASEFPGAEERMFRRFMEMEREEREKENLSEDAAQDNMTVPGMDAAGGGMGADGTDKNKKKIRKFGKKKVFLVAALVAVFVGALGVTAVGEKNYFFRERFKEGYNLILNNDDNKKDISELEKAYEEVKSKSNIKVAKLGYIPSSLSLENLVINPDRVSEVESIKNDWINQNIEIRENQLDNGEIEYEAQFYYESAYYMLNGKMEKEDFINVIKNINYF